MGVSILLVQDNRAVRMLCSSIIRTLRSEVTILEAGDEAAARTLLNTTQPRLAVVDISNDSASGLEMAKRLKNLHPALKLVLLTNDSDPQHRRQATALGITLLRKPIGEGLISSLLTLLD